MNQIQKNSKHYQFNDKCYCSFVFVHKKGPAFGRETALDTLFIFVCNSEKLKIKKFWQRPTLPGKTQVPSALRSLTTVFGMGTGGTSSL